MFEDELSGNEDEWYFDSIHRYKRLNMFELQKTPFQLSFTEPHSICVLSGCNEAQSEITELSLPIKSISENSLSSSSDLKFKCGTFTDSVVSQVQVLYKNNKVVSSEKEQNGAVVYQLDSQSGKIKKINHLESSLVNPHLALNYADERQILLSKDTKSTSFIININDGTTCRTINTVDDRSSINDFLVPLFVSCDSVSFLNRRTGSMKFFDIRTSTSYCQTIICPSLNHGSLWTYSSNFFRPFLSGSGISSANQTSSKIFLLSNDGALIVYDSRNLNKCVADFNLNLKTKSETCDSYIELNCCPMDENVVSVSGFDVNVYVFQIKNDLEKLFMHDGHCHIENCDKETVVTSHAWMDCSDGISIASCAFNKTLHLWTCI